MRRNENILLTTIAGAAFIAALVHYIKRNKKYIAMPTQVNPGSADVTQTLPRGYRNNNPLNIRYNKANDWKGKVTPNTDGTFEQFVSQEYGYRAGLRLMQNKIKQGYNTVAELISVWAPATENNTNGYISRVCGTTGYQPATPLSATNREQLINMAYAMALVENGYTPMPDIEAIKKGWELL